MRGAAQLLERELGSPGQHEYTQVIIKESDRLQALVDRLLAPHRRPRAIADLNMHEVLERVRMIMLAEFPRASRSARLRRQPSRLSRRPRAADPGDAEHRAQRDAGDRARIDAGDARNRSAHASRAAGDDCPQAVSAGDRSACDRQRARRTQAIRDRIFFPLVSGREDGSGLGLTLAQNFIPQHDGIMKLKAGRAEQTFDFRRSKKPLP